MSLLTSLAYWLIVAIWLVVLCTVAVFYRHDPRGFGTTRLLLAIVAIEAFCNILQTTYIDGRPRPFPADMVGASGGALLSMLPKLLNIFAGILVLSILLLRWLPAAIRERRDAETQRELETHDPLTGLVARRLFLVQSDIECDRARRYKRALSLLILTVDGFEAIRERLGPEIGDRLLIHVAELCRTGTRSADIVARTTSEEFAVLLPETHWDDARRFAERLRQAVAEAGLASGDATITTTVSIGVTETSWDGRSIAKLMSEAGRALAAAKRAGGDRVCIFDPTDAWVKESA
jgi:diguanylate cyclase (GGDEF)-like protein